MVTTTSAETSEGETLNKKILVIIEIYADHFLNAFILGMVAYMEGAVKKILFDVAIKPNCVTGVATRVLLQIVLVVVFCEIKFSEWLECVDDGIWPAF